MHDDLSGLACDDILYDVAGTELWNQQDLARSLHQTTLARSVGGSAGAGPGRQLLARCGHDALRRLDTLVHIERDFPAEHDSGVLVVWASQLIETVLDELIATPVKPLSAALVAATQYKSKDRRTSEALEMWGSGRLPTTIGMVLNILLALRRAEQHDQRDLKEFLSQRFHRHYIDLLRGNHLALALDHIRGSYRNPAAHGLRTFSGDDYGAFARLAVARPRFRAWDDWGAEPPEPPPDAAVLHHHLTGVRWPDERPAPQSPLADLLSLVSPPESLCPVSIHLQPAEAPRYRDLRLTAKPRSTALRLNTDIEVTITCQARAWSLLLDVGTAGTVVALWPNAFDPSAQLEADQAVTIPSQRWPGPLSLAGATGEERLVAVASLDPLPGHWLPSGDDAVREVKPDQIAMLATFLKNLDSRRWSMATIAFTIES